MAQLTPSDLDAERIRQVTDRVLSDYGSAEPGLASRALRWVLDRVAQIIAAVIDAGGDGAGVALLGALIVGCGMLAWLLLRRVRRDRAHQSPPGAIGGRTARDWQADARRFEADQGWASALRCHYRALLADLITAGMIDEVAGRTARGYLRDVTEAAPDTAEPMTAVTVAFEAAWYDRREVTASDVDALRTAATTVRDRLSVPARASSSGGNRHTARASSSGSGRHTS
ncbi:hypothetical protein BH23ACT10_BH23ACT10_18710 [soil metagenome]